MKPLFILFFSLASVCHAQVVVHVLGTAQDAGRPQAGCVMSCCVNDHGQPMPHEPVVSLGVVGGAKAPAVLVEATPDLTQQWNVLTSLHAGVAPKNILITHAHMGHYTGLMFLGREAMNSHSVQVHGSARLCAFLAMDQPLKQLVDLQNIWPQTLVPGDFLLFDTFRVSALSVPHRDEVSDTYAYLIIGPQKTLLFVPDIDKWNHWTLSLDSLLDHVDYALLDATFYSAKELPGRNMDEIPHPFVIETMQKAKHWDAEKRAKVHLIHYNHSNPLLDPKSEESQAVLAFGFGLCRTGDTFAL